MNLIEALADFDPALAHDSRRDSDGGAVGGDFVQDHRTSGDAGIVPHLEGTEHLGARADEHAVSDGWVAFAGVVAGSAEGNALIYGHVVADHGRFADNNTGSVVNEKTFSDGGGGMYFYTGFANRLLGNVSGDKLMPVAVEEVGSSVHTDGAQSRIEKKYFQRGTCRRVSRLDGIYIFFQSVKHIFTFFIYLGRQRPCFSQGS